MKPFNLEEAKAGKPICDRLGRDCKFIAYVEESERFNIVCLDYSKCIQTYTNNGNFIDESCGISDLDIFMKSERKEAWVNVYGQYGKEAVYGINYSTKDEALKNIIIDSCYLDTVKIEYNS